MVPETAASVLAFILFIVPGIVFELLRQTRRPRFEQSTFEEVTRVVLASVVLSLASITILAVASLLAPPLFINMDSLVQQGMATYWKSHWAKISGNLLSEVLGAAFLGVLVHRSLNYQDASKSLVRRAHSRARVFLRHRPGDQTAPFPVWRTIFRDSRPPGADTQVAVVTRDGSMWMGRVAAYDSTGAGDERDLALQHPVTVIRKGENTPKVLDETWLLVILPGAEVTEIYVTYPPATG